MRAAVMQSLGQPNGKADEPWNTNGDFRVGDNVYLSLSAHQTEGEFWEPLIAAAIQAGVQEITKEQYEAAVPTPAI